VAADTPDLNKPEALITMGEYTMDEAKIMYDYCGIVIEDFAPLLDDDDPTDAALAEDLEQKIKNPAFTTAMLHISYRRANPRASESRLKRFFGSMDRTEAMELFVEISGLNQESEEEDPTKGSTSEPDESSPRNSTESSESSGTSSTRSSEGPDGVLATTGTDESDTSSLVSVPTRLAR